MSIVVANAPVSYGAFELTVGIMPNVPEGAAVLDDVAGAGYAGIDLGPAGYLAPKDRLSEELGRRHLGLAGGFLELPFSDPGAMRPALEELEGLLDTFDAAHAEGPKPRPTLAAVSDRSIAFDAATWKRFGEGVEVAVARCRERGYEPTFHPETGSQVQSPAEIERVLELTTIGLCLDTGHLLLGGGDPMAALGEWRPRINHLHLKDARRSVIDQIIRESAPPSEIWKRKAFCRLGDGDVDVDAVLESIRGFYSGWMVVEQDTLPDGGGTAAADQRANREFLKARGF